MQDHIQSTMCRKILIFACTLGLLRFHGHPFGYAGPEVLIIRYYNSKVLHSIKLNGCRMSIFSKVTVWLPFRVS